MFLDVVGRCDWVSLDAYQSVTGRQFEPVELNAIRAMDAEYQKFTAEKKKGDI